MSDRLEGKLNYVIWAFVAVAWFIRRWWPELLVWGSLTAGLVWGVGLVVSKLADLPGWVSLWENW